MTAADWGILIPAIVALLGAGAAYLRARTAHNALKAHVAEVQQHIDEEHS